MNIDNIKHELLEKMEHMPVVDCHEHFCPEKKHLDMTFTFYGLLKPYIENDLKNSGMNSKWYNQNPQTQNEIDECFDDFEKYWRFVKNGSYARPLRIWLEEFYGFDDITRDNYMEITKMVNERNKPGLYDDILFRRCNIEYMLNQHLAYSFEEKYMKGAIQITLEHGMVPFVEKYIENTQGEINVDTYLEYVESEVTKAKNEGAVLLKFDVSSFINKVTREDAFEEFELIKKGKKMGRTTFVEPYLCEKALSWCEKYDMVAAVHTGVWGDTREKAPGHMHNVIYKYSNVKFDIYHAGMPYINECGFLGKNAPNTYLNLCWSYIVSPEMTKRAINEWLDYVPANKIFAFGGDYFSNPENIWGHLMMAKDTLSDVFAYRINKGFIDIDGADEILRMWFYENPKRVYNLK